MIDTGAFKTAIVDLAVTGQLSAQFRADDSVEEIIAALPPLSNKRKKLLGQNFEYGKQASLPDHWRWICLGEISSYGDTPTKAYFDDVSGDTWLLNLEDIRSGGQIIKKTRVHGKKFIGDKTVFSEGQVLYSKLRPYLKKVLVADEDGISTPELISFDTYGGVIPQYIVYCLLSSFTDRAIEKRSYGIKMPRIDAAFMVNLPIPVPPVSEQQFIVERVQDAFSQIDTIDGLQAQYNDNLTVLKGKLIDAAIQGKLTEQLLEDGTAEELYQQIQAAKQGLVKASKIKKGKPLSEINPEDIPFEIPTSWKWVRLASICENIFAGGDKPEDFVKVKDDSHQIPVVANAVSNDGIMGYTATATAPSNTVTVAGRGTIGFTCFRDYEYCPVVRLIVIKPADGVDPRYIYYVFRGMPADSVGSSIPQLTVPMVNPKLIPLPPLAEQKRIIAKLDETLPVCEKD